MSDNAQGIEFTRDNLGDYSAFIEIEGVSFQLYSFWHNDNGERWDYGCTVMTDEKEYDGIQSTRPDRRDIIDMLEWFRDAGVIREVPLGLVDSLASAITNVASRTQPTCTAHQSYFGM